jgi:biotin-(acetyl-CoA carboxylase) ligase
VLGIGINVALDPELLPEELRERAGTLGRTPAELESTLERLRTRLEHWLSTPDVEVLEAVRARDALRGRRISWGDRSGVARGIDADGRLEAELDGGGRIALDAGEVHLSRF